MVSAIFSRTMYNCFNFWHKSLFFYYF